MLGNHGRSITAAIWHVPARALAKAGVTPNTVTLVGAVTSWIVAAVCFLTGRVITGVVLLTVVLLFDALDGTLARLTTGPTRFGAFYDSTLDRLTDGFVFASIAGYALIHLPAGMARVWAATCAVISIVLALTVSYARARGESIGVTPKLGIAERTDRLVVALGGMLLHGLGLSAGWLALALTIVVVASAVTVAQRIWFVARHVRD